MATKQQKLQEILESFQNQAQDNEFLNQKDPFAHYSLNLPFIQDRFHQKYFFQQAPDSLKQRGKYRFINCQNLYQRRLAIYDQINYIEARIKDNYLPRDTIVQLIEEDWNTTPILKRKGNNMITKCLPNNTVASIFPYFPYNLGILFYQFSHSKDDITDPDNRVLTLHNYDISKRISPTQILQIEKGHSNDLLIRSLYKCFKLKFDLNNLDSSNQFDSNQLLQCSSEMSFPSEVLDCKSSPFSEEKSFFLCAQNQLYLLDDNKPHTIPFQFAQENASIFDIQRDYELMDTTYSPHNLLLCNYRQVLNLDIREKTPNLLISNPSKESMRMIYALKHLQDQYFSIADRNALCIYDFRYPQRPVFEFPYFCDENPIDIIDYSQVYDPLDPNGFDNIEDLLQIIQNNEAGDSQVTEDRAKERLLYGFSTSKRGSALLFPNKVFEKFEGMKDKYYDLEKEDKYMMTLLMARKPNDGSLSALFFEKYNQPQMLWSSSMLSSELSIRGMSAMHFDKDILVSVCDKKSNVSFHVIREEKDSKYTFHRVDVPESQEENGKEQGRFSEWDKLNKAIEKKIYHPRGFNELLEYQEKVYPKKIRFGEENKMELEEEGQNLDDVELEEEEDDKKSKVSKKEEEMEDLDEDNFMCYNFRPIAELITKDEQTFKYRLQKLQRMTGRGGGQNSQGSENDIMSMNVGGDQAYGFFREMAKEKEHSNNDFLRSLMGEKKKNTDAPKATQPFVITKSLLSHLEEAW